MQRLFSISLFLLISCALLSQQQQEQVAFDAEFDIPVRMTRTFGLSGNIGLKSLTGFGVSFQYYVAPKFALDGGVGVSNYGFNLAGRGRYIFTSGNFAPFVSAGFIYGTGSSGQPVVISDIETGNEIGFVLDPSRFVQIMGGGELVARKGFFLMFGAGISILTNPDNYEVVHGNPSQAMYDYLNFVYGTGFCTEVSIGYIFGNKKGYRGGF
jgi:hypothetical protein